MKQALSSPNPNLSRILEQLRDHFQKNYQDNLVDIILFGSQARGDAAPDSDIDILVLLKNQFDSYQENKANSQFIADLCLQYDTVISCFLMNFETWQNTNNAFIRNVRQEGVSL
ncbi:nucleotidyltransferase domain-containing protein [Picosynechococcus sp. PCC 11901]|uniref:nucleotidyltransferase domain-containing protein n=1 Tax=Picosynechococcus sp. PCC 11901 TaxID=2579791 RepID=UPI0010FBC576|nr:nucleotidyltransferase domain-containing protein [Picosynechococcus sp. PCC 11901]QCS48357.1 nucleotidyltransferase domain-containing protein [Picosynechococcus sp. PCC 11901]